MTELGTATTQVDVAPASPSSETAPLLLGHSHAFCRLREHVARVASADAPVLLRGERGSGKALLACAIHRASGRAGEPFVRVSCADTPETLLETELFGCVKGAVVGASCDRHGVLDMAHGGSIFLEDIDQASPRTQSLLVRFLETGDVHKVGAFGAGTPADVRVLASVTTRAVLARSEWTGGLRADLRAYFMGAELNMPALRERRGDIPILADYFARAAAGRLALPVATFSPQAHNALEAYSWPGNVSELKQVVKRVVAEARFRDVRAEDLPVGIRPRLLLAARASRGRRSVADDLFARLVTGGESFWTCVYPLFMRREITRMHVREIVRRGRDLARDDEHLLSLFNMRAAADHRRFERFLKRYACDLPSFDAATGQMPRTQHQSDRSRPNSDQTPDPDEARSTQHIDRQEVN